MTITLEKCVGDVATEHPQALRVFEKHGIDYCCGGGRALHEVLAEKGIGAEGFLAEIEAAVQVDGDPNVHRRWDEAPLGELIDHILDHFHRPLDEDLPRLTALAEKVWEVHGKKDPKRLRELCQVFYALREELELHMQKEEQILFPMILSGRGALAGAPVGVMEREHDAAGVALRRLRALTDDYTVPAEACATWRALWEGLAALERDLHAHIHLENNILFPRALGG